MRTLKKVFASASGDTIHVSDTPCKNGSPGSLDELNGIILNLSRHDWLRLTGADFTAEGHAEVFITVETEKD